jgi:hypothetical protein
MLYSMSLTGTAIFEVPDSFFPGKPIGLGPSDPWTLEFWCGGWDADAQSGHIIGYLGIPLVSSNVKTQVSDAATLIRNLSEMIDDPLERRL